MLEFTSGPVSQIAFSSVALAGYFATMWVDLGSITIGIWCEIGTQTQCSFPQCPSDGERLPTGWARLRCSVLKPFKEEG